MKRTNGQGGITLIALVVTIVVLLILAGITITYVLADDGLFGKAQEAAEAQEKGAISDYAAVATADAAAEWYTATDTSDIVALDLVKANFPTGAYTVANGETPVSIADGKLSGQVKVTVTKTSNVYTVDFSKSPFTVTAAEAGD